MNLVWEFVLFCLQNVRVLNTQWLITAANSLLQHFAIYLLGVHFTVETEPKTVAFLKSCRTLTSRLARWTLLQQEYDFTIKYRPEMPMQMMQCNDME